VHFAPVAANRDNLLREGISPQRIHLTGNPVIDALLYTAAKDPPLPISLDPRKRLILVTAHRRENFGEPFAEICRALREIAQANPEVEILYPVHPNPHIHGPAYQELAGRPGLRLCAPLKYPAFVAAMKRAYLILSDSGGVQEEAPALGKPVLVLRDVTERAEAEEAGLVKLVGPHGPAIVEETQRLLDDQKAYRAMARGFSPYGDGQAAQRITAVLKKIVQDPSSIALS
jgi:UDP-N-acetylglucosamine 2-epimerase (non-hydrolysing)